MHGMANSRDLIVELFPRSILRTICIFDTVAMSKVQIPSKADQSISIYYTVSMRTRLKPLDCEARTNRQLWIVTVHRNHRFMRFHQDQIAIAVSNIDFTISLRMLRAKSKWRTHFLVWCHGTAITSKNLWFNYEFRNSRQKCCRLLGAVRIADCWRMKRKVKLRKWTSQHLSAAVCTGKPAQWR